jgi:hypothetical protein
VLAVVLLQSGEVAFKGVGRFGYFGVIEVMKHIRQGTTQHAPGAFDVTEDRAALRPALHLGGVSLLPRSEIGQKACPLSASLDMGYLGEELPEPPRIGSGGSLPAPGQALPLDMDKTPLYCDSWPDFTQGIGHVRVAIDGKASRVEAHLLQMPKERRKLRLGAFGNRVAPGDDFLSIPIHQGDEGTRPMKEGAVEDEVLAKTEIGDGLWRRLLKTVGDDAPQLGWAMAAEIGYLPYRVTLNDPKLKPRPLLGSSSGGIGPRRGLVAAPTEPTLLTIGIMAIFLEDTGA